MITKLNNLKETNDPADIAAYLIVLEKLQKFNYLKTEYFESVMDEEIDEIEISLAEMDSDKQDLEVKFAALLHNYKIKNSNSNDGKKHTESSETPTEEANSSQGVRHVLRRKKEKKVLATTVVYISDRSDHFQKGCTIIDSGNMCCFITSNFADLLGLKKLEVEIPISVVGGRVQIISPSINRVSFRWKMLVSRHKKRKRKLKYPLLELDAVLHAFRKSLVTNMATSRGLEVSS
ncbi:hypothetical protein NPIL_517071 [Nephila pilipes]|uniref:Uncharacterized protein n=1 Tax=Nephila pilipes TaxID=299642 RepID=A0A8X6U866_NEPPI|nr:hypothetical protein NPIL_517071 [Nephila pilipes]